MAGHRPFMCPSGAVPAAARKAPTIAIVGNGGKIRGVISDWHGVLTPPLLDTVRAWVQADGIDWDSYVSVVRQWVAEAYDASGKSNPIHALERGEWSGPEFEQVLARVSPLELGPPVGWPLKFRISSPDPMKVRELAQSFASVLGNRA